LHEVVQMQRGSQMNGVCTTQWVAEQEFVNQAIIHFGIDTDARKPGSVLLEQCCAC